MEERKLKVKDIHTMYKKVYYSANELVKDAKLLFEYGSYARAYNIAQAALEEYGKLNMLYACALRIHNKDTVTLEEMIVRLKDKNIDDDLGYGIMLLIEKDYIKYPPAIDSILHQPKLESSLNINHLEEQLANDDLILNLLETYKELKGLGVLDERDFSNKLYYHAHSLKKHSLQASFYNEELVMPFQVIREEICTARIMTVLVLQRIYDITGYQHKNFDLFKYGEEYNNKVEEQLLKL